MTKYSNELMDLLGDQDQLPSWVQAKITKAADYLEAVKHHLEYERVAPSMHENKLTTEKLIQAVKNVLSSK